jgi:hypothetical protein
VVYACHCRECQKQSASAFALSMPMRDRAFALKGEVASFERTTGSEATTLCFFCPGCGTRIYHRSSSSPGRLTLKAGTLDDTAILQPVAHLWTRSKQPWVLLPDDIAAFETQPDNFTAWREELANY